MVFNVTMIPSDGDMAAVGPVIILFALLIVLLQLRERRVRPSGLVIVPLLMAVITFAVISFELQAGWVAILTIVAGLLLGSGVGLVIASRMIVKMDEKGRMVLKGSVIAVLIWMVVIILKVYGKDALVGIGDPAALTSAALAMTLGAMTARRAYVLWKYLQLKKQKV
jgi:membrane protein CcdC involved in cytochrome C biogenesis